MSKCEDLKSREGKEGALCLLLATLRWYDAKGRYHDNGDEGYANHLDDNGGDEGYTDSPDHEMGSDGDGDDSGDLEMGEMRAD